MRALHRVPRRERGGFVIGLVVGLLIGLALALGVALYVTKAPNPFVNKVPPRPPGQDAAEAERNRSWDPNSALAGRNPAPAPATTAALPAGGGAASTPAVVDPSSAPRGVRPASGAMASVARPASGSAASGVGLAAAARASQAAPAFAGGDPFFYFVQAGAYASSTDAEQQRAKLAMLGVQSKLTEREQGGRTVFRVRVGPFDKKDDADAAKEKLSDAGVDSALVRVQK